ncbi:MAG: peptidase M16 [Gammaproteobacteria bacterium SG8_11]|nr:MAG: peptidase M16 [Gammaproteobacteria bacterium SG8_11]
MSTTNVGNTATDTTTQAPATKIHPAFEWKRSETIEALNITIEEYQHKKTGALHYHLAADNPENVFLVALRTVPTDSTGVAHILEHTALCGSKRYPVRDPFFMMIRRSLNTFMNAFTSSDWTAYPFASQNKKDFNNLLDVYLDAVFFTNLNELDFAQEGHRLEFEKPDDPSSKLMYKGVVYNEMKGAMGSPVSLMWQTLTKYLFPTTTYHYNSGGDPECIPDLSYEQLKAFYTTHYHPSNAVFMTYGDIPAIEHQSKFEELALQHFDKLDDFIAVKPEKRYHAPLTVEEYYPVDETQAQGDKTHVVIGWLLGDSTDLESQLKTHLLSGVLLDNSASPLRKALETTDLGSSPSPLCGIEDSNREMTFMCGLEGAKPENAAKIEALVLGVLEQVAEEGVPLEQVEAILHQLELEQREIGGGGYPYGLQLILDALSTAVHRGDPVTALNIDPVLNKLRQQIQDPQFVKSLVKDMLLQNRHRVRLTLKPDPQLSERREQAEAEQLTRIKASLSDEKKQRIVQQALQLAKRQQQKDDEEILPKVGLEDIPPKMHIAEATDTASTLNAKFYAQPTNGLVYQQVVVSLPKLEDELIDLLPYYTYCLTEVGCGDKDYLQMQARQAAVSGGISAQSSMRGKIDDVQDVSAHLFLSGKALLRNSAPLTELLRETMEKARFDEYARIRELVAQMRAQREQSVMGNGHGLAMAAACSGMSPAAAIKHRLSGLEGTRQTKLLDDSFKDENNLKAFAHKLSRLHQRILDAPRQYVLIGESDKQSQYVADLEKYWQSLQTPQSNELFQLDAVRSRVKEMWITSTPVNFCAKAYPAVPVSHPDAPALTVLSGFLRNGFLHREIREHGGAYGGGASYQAENATFRFFSYRDPRLLDTLNDFDNSIQWLLSESHEPSQIEEAILGVISSIDRPSSPSGEAKDAFVNELYGRTPEQRQHFRSQILTVTLDDLRRVANTYFNPDDASIAVITNSVNAEQLKALDMKVCKL